MNLVMRQDHWEVVLRVGKLGRMSKFGGKVRLIVRWSRSFILTY